MIERKIVAEKDEAERRCLRPAVADIAAQPRAPGTVLRVTGLSKTFPGTKALDDVTLEVAEGEIHALVGQNGSGKSTLIKVLAGYHQADPGAKAWLNDEPFDVADTADSRHHRLRFVHQDLGLFLELDATDNLALRGEFLLDPLHRIRWKEQAAVTRELLGRFDLDLDLWRPLSEATPVQRTIVAIAAALVGWEGGPGVLVLDEPTAVLPPHDVTGCWRSSNGSAAVAPASCTSRTASTRCSGSPTGSPCCGAAGWCRRGRWPG